MKEIIGDNEKKKVIGTVRNSTVKNSKGVVMLLTKNISIWSDGVERDRV